MESRRDESLWVGEELQQPHAQSDKAVRVKRMFDAIAPTYALINTLFSGGRDRAWRRSAVRSVGPTASDRLLDIACGTGDFARAFGRCGTKPGFVVGCDFAFNMLTLAAAGGGGMARWAQGDALTLPFSSGSFTITSCAFGVRNLQDLDSGLGEMFRVLAPGGRAVILEFTRPSRRLWRWAYEFYSTKIMPLGATLVSRDRTGAYRYLPSSVVSFGDAESMCARLRRVGFETVTATPLTLGVVTVYVAIKGQHERGITQRQQ